MSWILKVEKYFDLYEIFAFMSEEEAIAFQDDWNLKGEIYYKEEE